MQKVLIICIITVNIMRVAPARTHSLTCFLSTTQGHVVGQFPVLHLVASNSSFESHMLTSDPLDMLPPLTVAVHDAG